MGSDVRSMGTMTRRRSPTMEAMGMAENGMTVVWSRVVAVNDG